jgi:hypothetical protein
MAIILRIQEILEIGGKFLPSKFQPYKSQYFNPTNFNFELSKYKFLISQNLFFLKIREKLMCDNLKRIKFIFFNKKFCVN